MPLSHALQQEVLNHILRTNTWAKPSGIFLALIAANKGYWTATTAYTTADYVISNPYNGRLYKCTTGGTSGGSQPVWPVTEGGTVADGTVVWTEQTTAIKGGTFPEPSGGSYARLSLTQDDASWTAPGTSGFTENVSTLTFPAPTGNWGTLVGGAIMSASSGGTLRIYGMLASPTTVNSGNPAPKFNAGDFDVIAI